MNISLAVFLLFRYCTSTVTNSPIGLQRSWRTASLGPCRADTRLDDAYGCSTHKNPQGGVVDGRV